MSKEKKILFVGHNTSLTGAPKSLLNIAKILKNEGFTICFLLGGKGPMLKKYEEEGDVLFWRPKMQSNLLKRIFFKVKNFLISYQNTIIKKVKNIDPDIIFNNTVVNGEIVSKLKHLNIPIVSRIPELETVIKLYNKNKSSDIVLENSKLVMAVSKAVSNNLLENHKIKDKIISTVYGFIPPIKTEKYISQKNEIRAELKIPKDAFLIGACGTLIARKGVDLFINTAEKLKNNNDVYFLWLGGAKESLGYIEAIEEIKKRGLSVKVFFIGEQEKPYRFYATMDVFYMSSREDPFPLSMLEAAQFNTPILGFKKGGGVEELLEKGGGFLADYADTGAIAEKIIELKNNQTLYKRFVEEIKIINKEFNEENSKIALLKFIEKAIAL